MSNLLLVSFIALLCLTTGNPPVKDDLDHHDHHNERVEHNSSSLTLDDHDDHDHHDDHDSHTSGHLVEDDHDDHDRHDDHDNHTSNNLHDDHGHGDHDAHAYHPDHARAPWEFAGIYELTADEHYTWSVTRSANGRYAAKDMKLLALLADSTEHIEDAEEAAQALWENATWSHVHSGQVLQLPQTGAMAAYILEFDQDSWVSLFHVKVPRSSSYVLFLEHAPEEFENGLHYFKDQHGANVEPSQNGNHSPASTAPAENEDNLMVCKWISALLFMFVPLLSAFFLRKVSKLDSRWLELCNACAGGVLIVVGLIHMMHENVGLLTPWGKDIAASLGGGDEGSEMIDASDYDAHAGHGHRLLRGHNASTGRLLQDDGHNHGAEFPLGYFLFVAGFFLITLVDKILGHDHAHGHSEDQTDDHTQDHRDTELGVEPSIQGAVASQKPRNPSPTNTTSINVTHVVGFNALIGISIHSIIEAFAVGTVSGKSEATFMLLAFSIATHKFFEIPAIFSSFLAVLDKKTWWASVILFSFVTPVGLLMGMLTASSVEHEVSAFLQCFAAGTLVAVGINHMLMPAVAAGTQWQVGKVVAAFLTAVFLTVLPLILTRA